MPTKITAAVKMFRVGELGDCFLLAFKQGRRKSHVLIDCGSFRNSSRSKERLREIAQNIKDILGKDKLDVVVGTHQHNDHYSGFEHAKEIFQSMEIDAVWLSWLDDPQDLLAQEIVTQHHRLQATLVEVQAILGEQQGAAAQQLLDDIQSFVDFEDQQLAFSAHRKKSTTDRALEVLHGLAPVNYLSPGAILDLPGIYDGGVKVYVLGPPRNYKQIKDTRPGKGETYDKHLSNLQFHADEFLDALKGSSQVRTERNYPFSQSFKQDPEAFKKAFPDLSGAYEEESWQQIDEDWLQSGAELALHLNSYTNNTSLVLAFELVHNEKVLLFVGDAQTGNWLSWDQVTWEDGQAHFERLLDQTVLYKVGHHGSHNATLKPTLERMNHPELVAMIPVDDSDSNITKDHNPWKMPAAHLYERLIEKTEGRVIRMDHGAIEHATDNWKKTPKEGPLFWEYIVE